nr:D-alanyl-D-alanine carboxypeptidase family protein [Aquabacterium olei]
MPALRCLVSRRPDTRQAVRPDRHAPAWRWRVLLASLAVMLASGQTPAALAAAPATEARSVFAEPATAMPSPPEVAARAFILQDLASRQTLAARQADQSLEPASLTKLMTAWLVCEALRDGKLRPDQMLPVSERAWKAGMAGASRSFLKAGGSARVDDLLRGMVVHNANDATVALAEGLAGSVEAFVDRMNRQAEVFGLQATRFRNPEGLSASGHRSTARELSLIAARLVTDFPEVLKVSSLQQATVAGVSQPSRNLLLMRDPTVDGLQTGYTEAAGYGMVATARRSLGGVERRLIAVTLGAASPEARAAETQKLLNWGYSAFDMVRLFDAGQPVATAQVWKGQASTVRLGRPTPIVVVVPRGQGGQLQTSVVRQDPLMAPLGEGQTVARLRVAIGPQHWQDVPLLALEDVPPAGWFGRLWDAVRLGVK